MVVAIVGILASVMMVGFGGTQRQAVLDANYATVFSALETARSNASQGVGTEPHGVYIEEDAVTLFEGTSYTGAGERIPLSSLTETNHTGTTIVFDRITGETAADQTVTVTHTTSGNSKSVTVSTYGRID